MFRFFALMILSCMTTLTWSRDLVVSTQPIYLIAKEVTKGVEQPVLLLQGQTGHDVSLTPSHRKIIQNAGLVIWLGQAHEAPLNKLLNDDPKAIDLLGAGILSLRPSRNVRGQALPNTVDTHVWLDPHNAIRIGFFIAALRSQQQPQHRETYWKNARAFAQNMLATSNNLQRKGAPQPYWAYHDAYQYLEPALNLKLAGSMTDDPHVAPTLAQIKFLNDSRPYPKMCLLAEGHTSQNQYQKLKPVVFNAVDESMNGAEDFITAWKKLATTTQNCVLNTRK